MKIAVITTAYNDEAFLPQFLRHYGDVDRIFAFDNESTDRTAEILRQCPAVNLSSYRTGDRFDQLRKDAVINEAIVACRGTYDYVVVVDVDEFVVPKGGGSIRATLERNPRPVYGTAGYNMFSYPDDAPYDAGRPLPEQRRRGIPNDHYSKPIIHRPDIPLRFAIGRHYIEGIPTPQVDPRDKALFLLLHYRGFDEALYRRRCLEKRDRNEPNFHSYFDGKSEEDFMRQLWYEKDSRPPVTVV